MTRQPLTREALLAVVCEYFQNKILMNQRGAIGQPGLLQAARSLFPQVRICAQILVLQSNMHPVNEKSSLDIM